MFAGCRAGNLLALIAIAMMVDLTVACSPPPTELEVEPVQFSLAAQELPSISNICGQRGRLFAAGRTGGDGLILEEGAVGLSPVFLEEPLPPMSDCWQATTAEVFFVGGGTAVVRTPEGVWRIEDVATQIGGTTVSLNAVVGVSADTVFAVGAVDGAGALLRRQDGVWARLALDSLTLSELVAADVGPNGSLYAVGGDSAVRWQGLEVQPLATLSARLRAIAVGDGVVVAVASDGLVLELEGGRFVVKGAVDVALTAVAVSASGDAWLAGEQGFIGRYLQLESGELASIPRTAETPNDGDVVALQPVRDGLTAVVDTPGGTELWSLD